MPLHSNTIYVPRSDGCNARRSKAPFAPVNSDEATLKRFNEQVDHLLASKEWACRTNGQFDLSYEQALQCEEKCRKKVESDVPKVFWKPILQYVHGKVQSLAVIVADISALLQSQFLIGEKVIFVRSKDNQEITYEIVAKTFKGRSLSGDSESPCSSKNVVHAESMLTDPQKLKHVRYSLQSVSLDKGLRIDGVCFNVLRRVEPKLPTQKVWRMFIRTFAHKLSYYSGFHPWLVDEKVKNKFNLIDNVAASEKPLVLKPKKPENFSVKLGPNESCLKEPAKGPLKVTDIRRYFRPSEDDTIELDEKTSNGSQPVINDQSTVQQKDSLKGVKSEIADLTGDRAQLNRQARRIKIVEKTLERHLANRHKSPAAEKAYQNYAHFVVRQLTADQLATLKNESLRKNMLERKQHREQKMKMKNLTVEQKASYVEKQKAERQIRIMEEKLVSVLLAANRKGVITVTFDYLLQKFEDRLVVGNNPLPAPERVVLPEQFPNKLFGDALHIVAFVHCFNDLLEPPAPLDLSLSTFVDQISRKQQCSRYLAEWLMLFLRPLLNHHSLKKVEPWGVPLGDVELNWLTATEITLFIFRNIRLEEDEENEMDGNSASSNSSRISWHPELLRCALSVLENDEFGCLTAGMKICIYSMLVDILLSTDNVKDHIDDMHTRMLNSRQKVNTCMQALNQFYKSDFESSDSTAPLSGDEGCESSNGVVSQRQQAMLKEKARRKREARLAEWKRKREKKLSTLKGQLDQAVKLSRGYQQMFIHSNRLTCLGMDRNFDRYWFFGKWAPGVYLEKGWCLDTIGIEETKTINNPECTNEWYHFATKESVDKLHQSLLNKGVREGDLKSALTTLHSEIVASFNPDESEEDHQGPNDHPQTLVHVLKDELQTFFNSVCVTGLRQSTAEVDWSTRINEIESLEDAKNLLFDLRNGLKQSILTGSIAICLKRYVDDEMSAKLLAEMQQDEKRRLGCVKLFDDALLNCTSGHRLLFLLQALKSCVNWQRLKVKPKCKVCRKDLNASLRECFNCSVCNSYFHFRCLRSPSAKVDEEIWFCVACQSFENVYLIMKGEKCPWQKEENGDQRSSGSELSAEDEYPERKRKKLDKENAQSKEQLHLYKVARRVLKKVADSRLATSLLSGQNESTICLRRGRRRRVNSIHDIENSLGSYDSLETFFSDLKSVIEHGLEKNQYRKRTCDQLQELLSLVESMKVEAISS